MQTNSTSNPATAAEPEVALPAGRLLATVAGAGILTAAAWAGACAAGPWPTEVMTSGLIGIAAVLGVALLGVLLINPWKVRQVGWWMTAWMGGTVFRLLATSAAVLVIYSASPALAARAFGLAVGVAYLVTLIAEALTVTIYLRKVLPA